MPEMPSRPSIAILPFADKNGSSSEAYFADGIAEDLTTDLAKLGDLDVIARNSVLPYRGQSVVVRDVAQALGVRYVVEGSVKHLGDQLRVNIRLVDASTEKTLWTDSFNGPASGIFRVENEISRKIVTALGLKPSVTETDRMTRLPTSNLEAYDFYLRGEQAARGGSPQGLREALALYEKAETLDPGFAEAFAADARASVYAWRQTYDEVLLAPVARKRAYDKASQALKLNPELSLPYAILATIQVVGNRFDDARISAQRAVDLGPGEPTAHIAQAYVLALAGDRKAAVAAVETAMRIEPALPAVEGADAGLVLLLAGETVRAIEMLKRAVDEAGRVGEMRFLLAAAYAMVGRLDEARSSAEEGLKIFPDFNLNLLRASSLQLRNQERLEAIVAALHAVGIPDWPFGFTPGTRPRLSAAALDGLFGHIWQGRINPPDEPAFYQVDLNGQTVLRTPSRMVLGTLHRNGDELCEQSEYALEIAICGPVFAAASGAAQPAYTYVNSARIFDFSIGK
jgi:TolB-like protein/Flp pilus assembly protein TadD